jgi:GNAT superfamily N-acetyltransferase
MASTGERRARARGLGLDFERVDAGLRAAAMVGPTAFDADPARSCPARASTPRLEPSGASPACALTTPRGRIVGRVIEFRPCPVDEEPAATLAQGMRDEIAALYDGLALDGPDMPKAGPDELAAPGGTFVVGFEDGVAVCCGGLKRLPDGTCEIKKMFVVAEARGRGVARALLVELERRARELGYEIARLDTGNRQPHARRLYERTGYVPIENFNANPVATFFGEKRL